jgi:hypothetical protein
LKREEYNNYGYIPVHHNESGLKVEQRSKKIIAKKEPKSLKNDGLEKTRLPGLKGSHLMRRCANFVLQ